MMPQPRITTTGRHTSTPRSVITRRAWFADESADAPTPPTSPAPQADTPAGDASQADQWRMEDLPPQVQAYIKDLRAEARERRLALSEAEQAAKRAEQERLAKLGQWEELARNREKELQELAPYRDRAQALEDRIRKGNEARVNRIPEDMRTLIPADYTPERLSEWLDANESKLTVRPAPNLDAGVGGQGRAIQLNEDERRIARSFGMTDEQYVEMKRKAGM